MSALQTWRTTVAIIVVALVVNMAIARSWLPGSDGFAQNSTVASIKTTMETNAEQYKLSISSIEKTQNIILVRLIGSDVEQARSAQCAAIKTGNSAAAEGWRARLNASLAEYRFTASQEYALRSCGEY